MVDEIKWLVGTTFGVVALIGGVITRDRQMVKQLRDSEDKMHARINDVKDKYVKKADMDAGMDRISADVSRLREEIRDERQETNRRLDTIINSVSKTFSQAAIHRDR